MIINDYITSCLTKFKIKKYILLQYKKNQPNTNLIRTAACTRTRAWIVVTIAAASRFMH